MKSKIIHCTHFTSQVYPSPSTQWSALTCWPFSSDVMLRGRGINSWTLLQWCVPGCKPLSSFRGFSIDQRHILYPMSRSETTCKMKHSKKSISLAVEHSSFECDVRHTHTHTDKREQRGLSAPSENVSKMLFSVFSPLLLCSKVK